MTETGTRRAAAAFNTSQATPKPSRAAFHTSGVPLHQNNRALQTDQRNETISLYYRLIILCLLM